MNDMPSIPDVPSIEKRCYDVHDDELFCALTDMHFVAPQVHDIMHTHNCLEIGFCAADYGIVQMGWEHNLRYSPGTIVFIPSSVPHNQYMTDCSSSHWYYLCVNEDYLLHRTPSQYSSIFQDLMIKASHNGIYIQSKIDSHIFLLVEAMAKMQESCGKIPPAQGELFVLLLISLIAMESENISAPDKTEMEASHQYQNIEPSLIYINRHYREEIRIADLARVCAMSESHFRLVFSKCMGKPPLNFLNTFRIQQAMYLLRTTSDPAQNIALYVGFSSVATFNRNFREYVGQSPAEWRKNSRTAETFYNNNRK